MIFAAALPKAGVDGRSWRHAGGTLWRGLFLGRLVVGNWRLAAGAEIYADLVALFATHLTRMDRARALRLARYRWPGRENETRFALFFCRLFDLFMARAARAGIMGPGPEAVTGEAALLARIAAPRPCRANTGRTCAQPVGPRPSRGRGQP